MSDKRLFGLVGAETLHDSIDEVYELDIEPNWTLDWPTQIEVEEWSTHPPTDHLPDSTLILDQIGSYTEDEEVDEGWYDDFLKASHDEVVLKLAESVIAELASKITYRMADKVLGRHLLIVVDGGDGQPKWLA